jgi:hypothetical protein
LDYVIRRFGPENIRSWNPSVNVIARSAWSSESAEWFQVSARSWIAVQQSNEDKNMTILQLTRANDRFAIRKGRLLVTLLLTGIGLALAPNVRAVSPPPDGGYAGDNTAEGAGALFSLTSGISNTALGRAALSSDKGGSHNTATGYFALLNNVEGQNNTATGSAALLSNTSGNNNTATGRGTLSQNQDGGENTATGYLALNGNTTGDRNTANGVQALRVNTTGVGNTASGFEALWANTRGLVNTANGFQALYRNTTGAANTANGFTALYNNTTGLGNTANGGSALSNNTTGNSNIALGAAAGQNLTTGDSNIDIGNAGVAGEANTIRIGTPGTQTDAFIAGISNATVAGVAVVVDANGKLGTVTSSKRFKDEIAPMGKASEAILSLRPVTFCYKHEIDPKSIPQFGLVAEEVEKVNPDLVARDDDGKVYTVRYEAVNAMLLNEFLKQHRKVEELEAKLAQQQKEFTARLKEQDSKIQNVSDKVELGKPAPRTVENNH